MFSIALYNKESNKFMMVRDHVGICPIYIGVNKQGAKFVSSELKGIHDQCEQIEILLPGHYISNEWKQIPWYNPNWHNMNITPKEPYCEEQFRNILIKSVKDQLIGDVPFGLLISGGVDSSIIASITMKFII